MMPLTPAEKQKLYRERLKEKDPEKFLLLKIRNANRTREKRKKIAEYVPSEQEKIRKQWRDRKNKSKETSPSLAANSKRKQMVQTEIKEENIEIDDIRDLILAEEFIVDSEGKNESTDPIKTEEYNELDLTRCLENSQNQTNSILHEGFETDTEIQKKTEKRKTEDPDLSFFYSLLPDMNEMSMDQKRRFKIGILQLASEILQEK